MSEPSSAASPVDRSGTERSPADLAKWAAGVAAAELVTDGMRLGLGTGSTVRWFLEELARRGRVVSGVPTSHDTAERCRALGIGLLAPDDVDGLDLAVDGADEIDHELTATKGGGGALLREKVVAGLADRFVIIATLDKVVDRLGRSFPLPIEVVPFAVGPVSRTLERDGTVVRRRVHGHEPFVTDNGNAILDVTYPRGIADPAVTSVVLDTIPGVVTSGLFVEMAELAILGSPTGDVEHRRPASNPSD